MDPAAEEVSLVTEGTSEGRTGRAGGKETRGGISYHDEALHYGLVDLDEESFPTSRWAGR